MAEVLMCGRTDVDDLALPAIHGDIDVWHRNRLLLPQHPWELAPLTGSRGSSCVTVGAWDLRDREATFPAMRTKRDTFDSVQTE